MLVPILLMRADAMFFGFPKPRFGVPFPSTPKRGLVVNRNKNKRSVLRRQSRDRNRNTKWSVYCQYG